MGVTVWGTLVGLFVSLSVVVGPSSITGATVGWLVCDRAGASAELLLSTTARLIFETILVEKPYRSTREAPEFPWIILAIKSAISLLSSSPLRNT